MTHSENEADDAEWMRYAIRAIESTYGYEFQGDNLQEEYEQMSLFGAPEPAEPEQPPCRIFDWRTKESVVFSSLKRR